MKKIKFLGAAILAASLIFAGCANGSDDDVDSTPDTEKVVDEKGGEGSEENGGSESGSGEEAGGEENSGEGQNSGSGESSGSGDSGSSSGGESSGSGDSEDAGDGDSGDEDEDTNEYTAPDLTDYFKYELVSSPKNVATNKAVANWSSGSGATPNDDGTWTISSSASMWNGVGGICAAFTGFEAGTLATYEYIVFTVDTTEYEINNKDDGSGNCGVNIKVPDEQKDISSNYVENGYVRTYYAPMSLFGAAPEGSTEFAIIIGGEGIIKLNEVYFAAAEDPANKAITGITITPASATVAQGGSQQFTVKDSNFVNLTNDEDVAYTITGDAAEGSTITDDGLLTVGTTAGELTVTATYSVEGKTFTASATITVMEVKTNLVSSVELELYKDSTHDGESMIKTTGDIVSITDNTVTLNKPENSAWNEWSCQLFLKVTSDTAKLFEASKKYYVSVTVTSSVGLDNCTWKEDIAGSFYRPETEFKAGEPTVLTAEITGVETDYFKCIFAFPGAASTITISDITVYDITE